LSIKSALAQRTARSEWFGSSSFYDPIVLPDGRKLTAIRRKGVMARAIRVKSQSSQNIKPIMKTGMGERGVGRPLGQVVDDDAQRRRGGKALDRRNVAGNG